MYLSNNAYRVKGAKGAVVYDFSHGVLYHLNSDASELLDRALSNVDTNFSCEEMEFIAGLVDKEIISDSYVPPHDISDLKANTKIDFVWIEVTTGCNLKCVHCYDEASSSNTTTMAYPDFCHVIDEILDNDIHKIQLIGGEPFILGPRLKKYLDYCIGKFDYIEIFTNGTLVDENWVRYISQNKINIALSVYSYNEYEHNKVTGCSNSHKKTNAAIQRLYDAKIHYRVRNVLMAGLETGEKNTDLYELSTKKDIVRLVGRANLDLLDDKLLRKKLITKETFAGKVNKAFISRLVSGHNCFARRLYFSANLEVYPCVMERRISHGNLQGRHLCDILNPQIMHCGKDCIDECCLCEFRYSCFDCRPDSLDTNTFAKPWYCTYDPKTGEWKDTDEFLKELKN